jgi:uncharacterized protein YraI
MAIDAATTDMTSGDHMAIGNRVRTAAIAIATAVLLPLGLLAVASQAHAATTYQGKVTASALNVRAAPTSAAANVGTLRYGTTISIQCKVYGPTVSGNSLWYKLSAGKWVTARYVANIGSAPRFCGDGREYQGRVVAATSLSVRSGPTTADARVSSAPRGALLPLVCKVNSQVIDGNPLWYQLTGDGPGQWVAARYVSNVGSAPPYC